MQTSPNTVVGAAAAASEEAPLKGGGAWGAAGAGGARGVAACFGALTLAVTVALGAQIYYHDYQEEGPWRGAVSADARCGRVGAGALLAGGGALDAALATAACLAVERPLAAPLDASGAMLLWRYGAARAARAVRWGGADDGRSWPRALCALCTLHAESGAPLAKLPLARLLAPAVLLARESSSLAPLADYLSSLSNYTTAEISSLCSGSALVHEEEATSVSIAEGGAKITEEGAGITGVSAAPAALGWRVTAVGDGTAALARALAESEVQNKTGASVQATGGAGARSSGVAIADARDNYVALVLGVSALFGAADVGAGGAGGASVGVPAAAWQRDSPTASLDLTPMILTQDALCGWRLMVAGGSGGVGAVGAGAAVGAAASVAARLVTAPAPDLRAAVEAARDGPEEGAAVNVVAAWRDTLLAHADSRGAGLAHAF